MVIENNVIKVTFLRRPNRFQAYVIIDGVETMVHVPNTGRCKEILTPGCNVYLREESNPSRKTKYDLISGVKGNKLINIDSQIPNKVVNEALNLKNIEELKSYDFIQKEKTYGNSRFDFKLKNTVTDFEYYLEVKGVTLEDNGKAMFPDAPTERGTKHLKELIEIKKLGMGAGILFLMQMDNISYFTPHYEMDSKFSDALREAYEAGVDILAYECSVSENSIKLTKKVEVRI